MKKEKLHGSLALNLFSHRKNRFAQCSDDNCDEIQQVCLLLMTSGLQNEWGRKTYNLL
jgi:hypothetical protein